MAYDEKGNKISDPLKEQGVTVITTSETRYEKNGKDIGTNSAVKGIDLGAMRDENGELYFPASSNSIEIVDGKVVRVEGKTVLSEVKDPEKAEALKKLIEEKSKKDKEER